MKPRRIREIFWFSMSGLCVVIVLGMLGLVIGFIIAKGASVISWEFLADAPRNAMTEGGIWPAILGTLLLSLGAIAFALPLGLVAAIYLVEY
ncbi:MAG: phosphate ABC transporter, permease protein PstA, partial [bacterium]|nr:phosphate ABC transporter, permease protein PstA [bacterium]